MCRRISLSYRFVHAHCFARWNPFGDVKALQGRKSVYHRNHVTIFILLMPNLYLCTCIIKRIVSMKINDVLVCLCNHTCACNVCPIFIHESMTITYMNQYLRYMKFLLLLLRSLTATTLYNQIFEVHKCHTIFM